MQQPNVTPQGWGQPQPPAPQRARRSGGAVLLIIVLAIVGSALGMFMPTLLYAIVTGTNSPFGAAGLLAGIVAGLAGGIWAGLQVTARR